MADENHSFTQPRWRDLGMERGRRFEFASSDATADISFGYVIFSQLICTQVVVV